MINKINFEDAKRSFLDNNDDFKFINLDSSIVAYSQLISITQDKISQISILYGRPGVGKTHLLQNIFFVLKDDMPILLFKIPFSNIQSLLEIVYKKFISEKIPEYKGFDSMTELIINNLKEKEIFILLDEVQMYREEDLEYIRFLSDTKRFKFILAMHRADKELLMLKEYFSTRIWDTVQLKPISISEVAIYVQKRLLNNNQFSLATIIKNNNYKVIYDLTGGNLREINRLLFKTFDICEQYININPNKLGNGNFKNKFIEMAGIEIGKIDV